MKKGTKTALLAAAGCIAAGAILLGIGAAAGGFGQGTGHHRWARFPWYGLPGLGFLEDSMEELEDTVEDGIENGWLDLDFWDDSSHWDGEGAEEGEEIFSGDFTHTVEWKGSFPADLEVEIGVHALEIVEGEGDSIVLEGHNADRIQCYVKDGALRIQDVGKNKKVFRSNDRQLVLTVPAGVVWKEAELSAGLSYISAETLSGGDVSLKSDLGSIEIWDLKADELEADVDLGSIELAGTVNGDVTASTDMGSIILTLSEDPDDFNYEINTDLGSITVGNQDYSGMDREKIVENGSERKMKLDSSMGSIEILWESR